MTSGTTTNPMTSVTKDNQDIIYFKELIQSWDVTPPGAARDALALKIRRTSRNLGFDEAQTKALMKVLETAGEAGGKIVTSVLALAENRAKLQQGQQAEMAKAWFEANKRQGDSMAGIGSLFRVVAAFAKAFGADEFSDKLTALADEQMELAKRHYIDTSASITRTGTAEIVQGASESLEAIVREGIIGKIGQLGQSLNSVGLIQPHATAQGGTGGSPPPPVQGKPTLVSIADFRTNLADMGVKPATIDRIIANLSAIAKIDGSDDVINGREFAQVPNALRKGGLTPAESQQLAVRAGLPELAYNK